VYGQPSINFITLFTWWWVYCGIIRQKSYEKRRDVKFEIWFVWNFIPIDKAQQQLEVMRNWLLCTMVLFLWLIRSGQWLKCYSYQELLKFTIYSMFPVKELHWWCYKFLSIASPYYWYFWCKGTRSHFWQKLCQKERTGSDKVLMQRKNQCPDLKMQLGNFTLIFSENFHIFVIFEDKDFLKRGELLESAFLVVS